MQPLVRDDARVIRFQSNAIVRFLLDWSTQKGMGLNELALMHFSDEDRQQFAQLIGYSLSGYGELPYVTNKAYARAERMKKP